MGSLGSGTSRTLGSRKAAQIRSDTSTAHSLVGLPGRCDTDISQVCNGNNGTSCQQKLLPGSLQIYDVEAITSFVDVPFHLEVKVGDFPGGTVVKDPPANAGDTGSIPGVPGRSHMPRSS